MSNPTTQNAFLQSEEEVILTQMEELKKDLEAIQRLRKKYAKDNPLPEKVEKPINGQEYYIPPTNGNVKNTNLFGAVVPDVYSTHWKWEDRVLYVLRKLHTAYVDDVIEQLRELEPEVPKQTLINVVTNKLSKMFRNGKIKADTTGRKYKYYL